MKASIALVLAGSLLASAGPINKRAIHTDYVTDIVYVTVTVDPQTTTHHHTRTHFAHHTTTVKTTTSSSTTSSSTTSTSTTSTPSPTTTSTTTPPPPPPTTSTTTTPVAQVQTITLTKAAAGTTTTSAATQTAAEVPAVAGTTTSAKKTTTSAAAAASPTDFASTAVYHHNIHRSNHSAPAVSWDSDLASYAAEVAATCVFAHDLSPGSSTGSYGQNIAVYGSSGNIESTSSSAVIAQAITDMWYNGEVWQFPEADYGVSSPDMSNFESWGHFSQVVWVATTKIGCAAQYCAPGTIYSDIGSWFSVCDYRTAGNMAGEYGANVLKPLGEATVTA